MNQRRLEIFLTVVEEGGFTAAADALGMSQPAVSQAVGELERDLGALLFHRLGRSIALTSAGEALLEPARQTRRDLLIARSVVEDVVGLETGRLDIACLPTLVVAPLAPLVGRFRGAHPGVTLVLADPADSADLLALVRSGHSELGLLEDVRTEGLVTVSLGQQDFVVVLPPGTSVRGPFPLEELAALPLVATPEGSSTRALLDHTLAEAGSAPRVVVEAAQREALLPLIAAGAGSSLLPRPLAEVASALGCAIVDPTPPVFRSVALVHRDGPLTPAAARFVAMARAECAGVTAPR
jgi:LysR family transcriptional regulator, carnitine catabolism transcriptional activator